jgi:hypothetical protein
MRKIRNYVAHGAGHHLMTPVDSARTIRDAAEIINHLWGSSTPGGHLYPAPIHRIVQIVAWNRAGSVVSGPAGPPADSQFDEWTCVLVRAVLHDEGLGRLDALYDTTTYPCDVLWGPGTWQEACAWLERNQPPEDEVDVLDRLFLSRHHEGRIYLPRSLDVAAALGEEEQHGVWYLTRADYPADALAHTRGITAGQCSSKPASCRKCAAESVGYGTLQEMLTLAADIRTATTPRRPPDIAVPSLRTWPRYFKVVASAKDDTVTSAF